jgi:hypothetical protein
VSAAGPRGEKLADSFIFCLRWLQFSQWSRVVGFLLSCISTVKRSQVSTAGEALMQLEMFEANRLLLVFAVCGSSVKNAVYCPAFCGRTQS